MPRDIEVQDAPTIVADDEKGVQHAAGDRGDGEKVHRGDGFSMVAQETEPTLCRLGISRRSSHPPGDGSLGDIESDHEELAVNSRCSSGGIFCHHSEDQIANFSCYFSPPDHSAGSGDSAPVKRESRPVPSDHGFWAHDDECLLPARPEPSCKDPEDSVQGSQSWPGLPALQHCELLPKSQVFEQETPVRAEEAKNGGAQEFNRV